MNLLPGHQDGATFIYTAHEEMVFFSFKTGDKLRFNFNLHNKDDFSDRQEGIEKSTNLIV